MVLSSLAIAQEGEKITADQIMKAVRQTAVLQGKQTLQGVISKKGVKDIPLTLFLRGEDIQFMIDGGKEGFHLRLKEHKQELWELVNGKAVRFKESKIGAPVMKTDLSYEDLALKFLYWKKPWIVGSQRLNGMDCWRLHVINPEKSGRYREVSIWVTKKELALAKVVGYGPKPDSAPIKQFEIINVMKVNGVFTVETMKVTQFSKARRVSGVTYLYFKNPKGR